MTDWSVVGGNPVPADVGAVLGCARSLRGFARELQRWQHDAQLLFGRTATAWQGQAGPAYARSVTETLRQPNLWGARLHRAADALVRFAGELEALAKRAIELAGRAGSYAEKLRSIEIDQWYTLKLGISGWPGDSSDEQSLQLRWDTVRRLVEQVRSDYVAAEHRVVQALDELRLIVAPRSEDSFGPGRLALPTPGVDPTSGWVPVTSRLLAAMGTTQVAALFADLAPTAIRALALSDPAGVGNLDGVPLNARAMANHLLVERDRQLVAATGDGARLRLLDDLIACGGSLVVYEPALDHYAVLFGDQAARHIMVLVAGTGDSTELGGWVGEAHSIWTHSPDSAVIMWRGRGDQGTVSDGAVTGLPGTGHDEAHDLERFTDGLALADDQSVTVIAHWSRT